MIRLLVKDLPKPKTFVEWRKENYLYWMDQLPTIIENLFKRFNKEGLLIDIDFEDVSKPVYGFSSFNLKKINITTKDSVSSIYFPSIHKYDLFDVNMNYYVLIALLADCPVTTYDIIRIRYFGIDPDTLTFVCGKKQSFNLFAVLHAIGYIKPEDILVSETATGGNEIRIGDKFYRFRDNRKITPFDKLVILAFEKWNKNQDPKWIRNILNTYQLSTLYMYLVEKFYSKQLFTWKEDTADILRILIENIVRPLYNKTRGIEDLNFNHLGQKYVSFYDYLIDFMMFNLEKVLSRKQKALRFDSQFILKWLIASNPRFQLLQSFENPLRLINMLETVIFEIKNVPVSYRTVHPTYKYNIDPINTPDNDSIGVTQRITKAPNLDTYGRFLDFIDFYRI